MVQYKCENCNYLTNRKSSYKKHLTLKRHKKANEKSVSTNTVNMSTIYVDNEEKRVHKKVSCKYCDNIFFNSCSLKRHKETCKIRMKKIIKENKKLKEERDQVIKENAKIGYELACSEKKTVIMNMNYILNVFTDAHNIEDCLDKELTSEERQYLIEMGGLRGCNKFINDRCIENVSIEKRPFHCVDHSRDKFLTRSNDKWEVDMKAQIIMDKVAEIVTPLYPTNIDDLNQRTKNLKSVTDIKSPDANKIVMKNIKDKTILKNDIEKQQLEN